MSIREASQDDKEVLTTLIRASFRDVAERFSLTPENCPHHPSFCEKTWIEAAMEKGVRYFLLEDGGHPCGCVALEKAACDTCYLERLAVLPLCRRRGRGEKLVRHVITQARECGATRLEIGIIAEQRDLMDWYCRLGFVETGRQHFQQLPFEVAFMSLHLCCSNQDGHRAE